MIASNASIHPSAVIEDGAIVSDGCSVGAFSLIGADVKIEQNTTIKSHVVITGRTTIGEASTIYSFAVVGEIPQDLKFAGEDTSLIIGARARIREHVTINTGTDGGGGVTRIGDDCLLMAGCHIAHDAQLGDRVIVVNSSAVAGHCIIEDDVIIGGLSGIHQFVRIGQGAMIGALSMVSQDVMPFGLVQASRGELDGLNLVGLKRRAVTREEISAVRKAFKDLGQTHDGTFHDRAEKIAAETKSENVEKMVAFILGESDRGFLTPS